jgi:ATP-dependent Lon protease
MPIVRSLPLFPLELVLYPHQRLQLHIFEDRYKEMTARCLAENEPFGIVYVHDGKMVDVGCMAWILRVLAKYEDGKMDIQVEGRERFRVTQHYFNETYLTADVETLTEPSETPNTDEKERAITQHMRLLELSGQRVRPSIYQHLSDVSFVLAENAGLTTEQKQHVLEMMSENERLAFLTGHFESILPHVQELEEIRRKVKSNGHFEGDE